MMRKHIFALAFGLAAFTTAQAADEFLDDRFYVAPFGTYVHGGGDRNSFDGWGGGMAVGKIINEYFNVEVKGFWQQFNGRPDSMLGSRFQDASRYNADFTGGTIDLQYYFFRDAFSPYVVAGIGGMNTSQRYPGFSPLRNGQSLVGLLPGAGNSSGGSTASFIFETGVGATYEVLDNFLLRADVRYRLDTAPSSINSRIGQNSRPDVFNDLLVNVGFMIPFGDKPQRVAAVAPVVSDCATRDSDNDGVNDCDDKCPSTAKGTKVDEYGCPIRIELKGVNFMWDSPQLTETAKTILNKVAGDLSVYPLKKTIEVRGFASSEGQLAHNQVLSQNRSQSVADYLKAKGVANKMVAKGFGISYPIADNATEAGRIKNRRVELVWIGE
ncbi:MAG: OmpA family protein [Candidatus Methylumidiphilus sp.]